MLAIYLVLFLVYLAPGLVLARGMYGEQVRAIRNAPPVEVGVIPPKPKRPDLKLGEMLHTTYPTKCALLRDSASNACTCKYRSQWVRLKNEWLDYNEWVREYGHKDPSKISAKPPSPNMKAIYGSVPVWPLVMAGMYIKGGAKNIPDYREIERQEAELGIGELQ
jgi:hypothetical protein